MGVVSCFGATGLYDHGDQDPVNDICKLNIFSLIYTIRDAHGGGEGGVEGGEVFDKSGPSL